MKIRRTLPSLLEGNQEESRNNPAPKNLKKLFSKESNESPFKSHIQVINELPQEQSKEVQKSYLRRRKIFDSERKHKNSTDSNFKAYDSQQNRDKASNINSRGLRYSIKQLQRPNQRQMLQQNRRDNTAIRLAFDQNTKSKKQNVSEMNTNQKLSNFNKQVDQPRQIEPQEMINKISELEQSLRQIYKDLHTKTKQRNVILNNEKQSQEVSKYNVAGFSPYTQIIKEYEQASVIKESKMKVMELEIQRMKRCQRIATENEVLFKHIKEHSNQENGMMDRSLLSTSQIKQNQIISESRKAQRRMMILPEYKDEMVYKSRSRSRPNSYSRSRFQDLCQSNSGLGNSRRIIEHFPQSRCLSPLNLNRYSQSHYLQSRPRLYSMYQPYPKQDHDSRSPKFQYHPVKTTTFYVPHSPLNIMQNIQIRTSKSRRKSPNACRVSFNYLNTGGGPERVRKQILHFPH